MKNWAWLLVGLGLLGACSGGPTPPPEVSGADLARRLGCFACHVRGGQGDKPASPLDGVGSRLSPGDLQKILTFPRQLHPGAKMPSYAYLRPFEQQALLEFLENLK